MRTAYVVAPEADAADAVQDAFVKAYGALARFRSGAPIRPWLLRIVANEARNRRRSADRRAGLALRAAAVSTPNDELAPSPESAVLADETRGQLLAALGRLRDEEREVIGARYFLGPVGGRDRRVAVDPGRDRQIEDRPGARTSARRARRTRGRSARWLTSRSRLRSDGDLEAALRAFGEDVAWPEATSTTAGGDVAAAVRARIESSPRTVAPARPRWSWWPARRALVAAVLILLVLAALAGAATLGLPGLRLILGPAPVSPPPSLAPRASPTAGASGASAAAGAPGSTMGLGQLVPLDRARCPGRLRRRVAAGSRPRTPRRRLHRPDARWPGRARLAVA